jgi:hypothetical protein
MGLCESVKENKVGVEVSVVEEKKLGGDDVTGDGALIENARQQQSQNQKQQNRRSSSLTPPRPLPAIEVFMTNGGKKLKIWTKLSKKIKLKKLKRKKTIKMKKISNFLTKNHKI